jgi:hypothetical protein
MFFKKSTIFSSLERPCFFLKRYVAISTLVGDRIVSVGISYEDNFSLNKAANLCSFFARLGKFLFSQKKNTSYTSSIFDLNSFLSLLPTMSIGL